MDKSPFPGMDPYLEGELWQEFHQTLGNQIRTQLMEVLPSNYVALLEKYHVIEYGRVSIAGKPAKKVIYPDVQVTKIKEAVAPYKTPVTAPAADLISPMPRKVPQTRVVIRETADREAITVIEILSPANKAGDGLRSYVRKRVAMLQAPVHLLEIDFLRAGSRIPLIGELPPAPYYVFLSRFTRHPHTEVWPVQLQDQLPTVPVPLLPPDEDAHLILQKAMDTCFKIVRYHERLIDYRQPPPDPPFEAETLGWVESISTRYLNEQREPVTHE